MEIALKNYPFFDKKINITIPTSSIVGLAGSQKEEFISILSLQSLKKGTFLLGDNKITKENIKVFRRRIGIVPRTIASSYYKLTVKDFFITQIQLKDLSFSDTYKKLKDSLKIVNLSSQYLNKFIKDLSYLEKKLILIANILLLNPNIIILEEPFVGIDLHHEKKIINLLLKLQEKYQKTIIISTDNTNYIYKYTNQTIILNENNLINIPTNELSKKVEILKKNKIEIPPIVEFTYLAKTKKKVKLDYHKDIRDIIKDIYKHV